MKYFCLFLPSEGGQAKEKTKGLNVTLRSERSERGSVGVRGSATPPLFATFGLRGSEEPEERRLRSSEYMNLRGCLCSNPTKEDERNKQTTDQVNEIIWKNSWKNTGASPEEIWWHFQDEL